MRRKLMVVFRALGAMLGVLFIVLGVSVLGYFTEVGMLRRVAVGITMIVLAVYLLNYAITGRRYLFGRPPI